MSERSATCREFLTATVGSSPLALLGIDSHQIGPQI